MPTKKKPTKSSGKAKVAKASAKSTVASGKKSNRKKIAAKSKMVKGKKPAASKTSTTKSTKSASSAKKPKSTTSTQKKTTTGSASPTKKKTVTSTPSKGKTAKKVIRTKTSISKKTVRPKSQSPQKAKTSTKSGGGLTAQERYNVGGVCACVIETSTKEGQNRLERVLQHLNLSEMDQANLLRVSQGLRIPKLFADGLVGEETRRLALQELTQFTKKDDPSGKSWKTDLDDFARLLGS